MAETGGAASGWLDRRAAHATIGPMPDLYSGPIIDAHHHLWDLAAGHYPWLTRPDQAVGALGNIDYLRHTYLPADYASDIEGQNVVASVHIEALWNPARSPVEETAWLDSLPRPAGVAVRYVVAAPLASPDVDNILEAQAEYPRVAAVRETIRWHPDPAKRWTRPGITGEPGWRAGLARLGLYGWALELLMNPHQAEEVAALAQAMPDQCFIVNHCCTPNDRDDEGMARWRAGLVTMGQCDNIAIKLSNYAAYAPDRSFAADRDTLRTCIDAFSPHRCMFGSDYPVARRTMTYAALCERFREVAAEYTASEQAALFHDTASRLYGIGP